MEGTCNNAAPISSEIDDYVEVQTPLNVDGDDKNNTYMIHKYQQ